MFKALLKGEIIISLITIIGALYLYHETGKFGTLEAYGELGPSYWPKFLLISLILLSFGVAVSVFRKVKRGVLPPGLSFRFDSGKLRFYTAAALIALYLVLMKTVGFLVLTPFVMIAFMYLLGEKKKVWIYSVPFVLTLVIVLLFTKAMYVPLPRGTGIFLTISHLIY